MTRITAKQSAHDAAVAAVRNIYERKGKYVWTNPGSKKNKAWNGHYIDVIVANSSAAKEAWVIEIETDDSVTDSEARGQWKSYDATYQVRWFLAVPTGAETSARQLVGKHGISHCTVITWARNADGSHSFWGLPGLN